MISIFNFLFLILFVQSTELPTPGHVSKEDVAITTIAPDIKLGVFLEGPMRADGTMHNNLFERGYLPGQKPTTFFGKATKAGQPYNRAPWHYQGKEGHPIHKQEFYYPPNTVDWVLVSLLANNESLDPVCRISGLLQSDGSVLIYPGDSPCRINPDLTYFVVVQHRNHLGVISHLPVRIEQGIIAYDFRDLGEFAARTTGLKIDHSGRRVMMAGNGDQASTFNTSFTIDEADLKMWRKENGKNSSYLTMDLDLSGDVSVKDQELLFNNYGTTTSVAIPH